MVSRAASTVVRWLVNARRPRHLVTSLAVVLAFGLVTWAALAHTGPGRRLEARSLDGRFQRRAARPAPSDVVLVAMDRQFFTVMNQWPVNRATYARVMETLRRQGVSAIVLDEPLVDPSLVGDAQQRRKAFAQLPAFLQKAAAPVLLAPSDDQQFLAAATAARPLVFATRPQGERANGALVDPLAGLAGARAGGPSLVQTVGGVVAVSAHVPDGDGVVRRHRVHGSWPGFGGRRDLPSVARAALTAAGVRVAALPASFAIDWYGPRGTFDRISMLDAFSGASVAKDLRGRIAIIGATDGPGAVTHRTPLGPMSAAEIDANALSNLRAGSWLREAPAWWSLAAALALVLLAWGALELLVLPVGVVLVVAGFGLYWWLVDHAFGHRVDLPMVAPLAAGGVAFVALAVTLALRAVRERLRIRSLFARYVSPQVVAELVESGDADPVTMGGEAREITVLFSDIRGFTTLSEHLDPTEMVEQLNTYFGEMVEVVTSHRGTLDKFLGDGLMAIFGAPVDQRDHATRACEAALEMLERLDRVNGQRVRDGLPELRIGIGVHTGEAVVGNIGSPLFRVDFTAIGDTVNLASRIEGMTKELGAKVLVSAATADAVRDAGGQFALTARGSVVARGRTQATDLFELTPQHGAATPDPALVGGAAS